MQISRRGLVIGAAVRALAHQPTFSTDVKVVTLLATVHDSDGAIVTNLNREDFLLEEDGVPQTIRYFSRESDLPLTLGLLVDTSRSQLGVVERERIASYRFLDQVLREDKDQAFVAHFDIQVEVLQDLTTSRTRLAAALDKLTIPPKASTLLYQAVRECSEGQMRRQQGRKAFIILSDGVDVHSKTTIVTAIEYAQRADTIIYSILFSKRSFLAYYPSTAPLMAVYYARGKHAMQRLARETGGRYYEVSKQNPIERIYDSIEEQLRSQYSIGYTPERKDVGGRYRQIRLTTRLPSLITQTQEDLLCSAHDAITALTTSQKARSGSWRGWQWWRRKNCGCERKTGISETTPDCSSSAILTASPSKLTAYVIRNPKSNGTRQSMTLRRSPDSAGFMVERRESYNKRVCHAHCDATPTMVFGPLQGRI
jgi:VWFA-related protein